MSVYEWERGTLKIPAGQWANFRKSLIQAWNDHQAKLFKVCREAYEEAHKAAKGKRGKKRHEAILSAVASCCGGRYKPEWGDFEENQTIPSYGRIGRSRRTFAPEYLWEMMVGPAGKVIKTTGWRSSEVEKITAPKKSDFRGLPLSKDAVFNLPDASISLRNETRSVTWDVPENNHAREHARAHFMAKELFNLLDQVDWKRGSGGQIVGNDEYNREERGAGEGGNYVIATYPPPPRPKTSYNSRGFGYRGW